MADPMRRLVFGEVAELYDASRPSYPDALVDDLAAWAGQAGDRPARALEVGAGTGKATRLLTARGVTVTAVEPSAEMAAVARSTVMPERLELIEDDFERADLGERRFPLVYAAQSWHWVAQPEGYTRARGALIGGGRLVVFWNRPVWERSAIREALDEVYDRLAPDLADGFARPSDRVDGDEDWAAEIAAVDGFADPEVRTYEWSLRYRPDEYADLVATFSEIRLLSQARRSALLAAISAVIVERGGVLELGMRVRACVARAV